MRLKTNKKECVGSTSVLLFSSNSKSISSGGVNLTYCFSGLPHFSHCMCKSAKFCTSALVMHIVSFDGHQIRLQWQEAANRELSILFPDHRNRFYSLLLFYGVMLLCIYSATCKAVQQPCGHCKSFSLFSEFVTGGLGACGEVGALDGDAEQGVRAGAVLVHLSAEGDPVSSGHG